MKLTKHILLLAALLLGSLTASAYDYVKNGIYYNIISSTDRTMEVTYRGNSYDEYSEYIKDVTIYENVMYINDNTYLVISIGNEAFRDCLGLTSITIPSSVKRIGHNAFRDCKYLKSVTINYPLWTSIGDSAFHNCSSLTAITIPASVTSIGNSVFSGCSSLTTINIPKRVTSIGSYAFNGCSSLASITIPENSQLTSIGHSAFRGCSGLTSITIPESVTSIGSYAFNGCSSLTDIILPEGVTSIGSSAFSSCSSLASIVVAEGNTVYDSRGGCDAIIETNSNTLIQGCYTTIIPEGVTSIGHSAFRGCSGLTSITIPESVTSIGSYAFHNCSSLTAITIPEGVTSIGNSVFSGCSSLTTINIPKRVTSIGSYAFFSCSSLTSITIPESVTSIGSYAFNGCSSLTDIILPESVTRIGNYACQHCSSLTTITTPESVTSIGVYAFDGCSSLTAINIPEGVTSIGRSAFNGCSSLASITCNGLTPPTIGNSDTFANVDKSIPVYVPAGSVEAYQSAEHWSEFTNYQPLSSDIASGTCGDNLTWKLTEEYELIIEGTGDMYDYTQGGTPWNEYRDAILTITLPEGMTRIGQWAFSDCTSITTITVPASVTSIGYGILMGCTNLTSIAVEEGNTVYDSRNGCNAIIKTSNNTLVSGCSATVIPEGVTSIGNRAFGYCTFTTIDIPEGVTSIGDYAFGYCSSLATIILPESMTTIGTGAFVGCRKLAELICLATTPPTLGSNTTFGNVNKSIPVYVPAASVGAYQSAAYWSEFTNILPIEEPTPDYVTITISKYGSGTYSSAYALDFSEVQGLKAYVATGYNYHTGVVTLLRVHTADAATGLLVKGTPGASYEVPVMEYTADRTLNMLVPTLERTEVDSHSSDGVYANYKYTVDPAQNPDEPLFYPFADDSHLSAGKAYLQIPVAWLPATGQKSIRYRFDEGETTDIEDEEIINHKSEIIYDLYGRRVVSPKKGEVYIINNKKVVY